MNKFHQNLQKSSISVSFVNLIEDFCTYMMKLRTEPKDIIELIKVSDYTVKELYSLLQDVFRLYEDKKELELLRYIKQELKNKSNKDD